MKRLLLLLLLVPGTASAARPDRAPSLDPIVRALDVQIDRHATLTEAQHAEVHRAGSRLISLCPDCRLATIAEEGPCGWARMSRQIIGAAVAKGMNEEEIVQAYVKTYGPDVLAVDTSEGRYQAMWAVPYVLIAGALALVFFIGRRARRRDEEPVEDEVDPEARARLDAELGALDG